MGQPSMEGPAGLEARLTEAAAEEVDSSNGSMSISISKEQERKRVQQQLWFDAIKLPLYSVAVNPILVPAPGPV